MPVGLLWGREQTGSFQKVSTPEQTFFAAIPRVWDVRLAVILSWTAERPFDSFWPS